MWHVSLVGAPSLLALLLVHCVLRVVFVYLAGYWGCGCGCGRIVDNGNDSHAWSFGAFSKKRV
jgi:hypothetical protein